MTVKSWRRGATTLVTAAPSGASGPVSYPFLAGGVVASPYAASLRQYLSAVRRYPVLTRDEEYALARRVRDEVDLAAAHRLMTSHLRLAAKIACGYRGYGLPLEDMISEANVGLLHAIYKFDLERDCRLSTYAAWWIRAALQDYILRHWSIVKLGTSATQKRLFFGFRRARARVEACPSELLAGDSIAKMAELFHVPPGDITGMEARLGGRDLSLSALHGDEGEPDRLERLADENAQDPETALSEADERDYRTRLLTQALSPLGPREQRIFVARRLRDPSAPLAELAQEYGVSCERIRQIEMRAFGKVQRFVTDQQQHHAREVAWRRGQAYEYAA